MLIDSHCHLDFPDFDKDRDEVVKRAGQQGIAKMVTISTKISEIDNVKAIAHRYPNVFYSVGTHPHNAEQEKDIKSDRLIALAKDKKAIGIGETGLDYHYQHCAKDIQYEVFIKHIRISQQTGLPLVVHAREADADIADILQQESKKADFDILLHCFSSGTLLANAGLSLGAWFSFSGIITFKNSVELCEIAKQIAIDKLLVETDAPYLSPAPLRGKRNEPSFVVHTAKKLAQIKELPFEVLAQRTTDNFHRLFKKAV